MATKMNPSAIKDNLEHIAEGLKIGLPPGTKTLKLDGVDVPVTELATQVKGYAAAYARVEAAEAERTKALNARKPIEPHATETIGLVKDALCYILGKASPDLAHFGFAPKKKRTKPKTKVLAAAADAAKATRDAGGKKALKKKKNNNGNGGNGGNGGAGTPPAK